MIVTVPTGVLRVYARYDNQLIEPTLGASVKSLADGAGVPFVGPGGPTNILGTIIPAEPVQVKAMAAYFSRHTSKVYKTQYCYVASRFAIPSSILLAGASFCVPAFARSLKVLRMPITAALDIALYDNSFNQLDSIPIPSGTAPIIPIVGTETLLSIASHTQTAPDAVTMLAFCYEIGL